MQAVILAGGRGERLRPLTDNMPKPMIPINGKPFLRHQLELVKSYGIRQALLLVGYLGDKIEAYFGDGSRFGLAIEYFYEKTLLGTGGGLKNAENKIKGEFLLLNGDTYLPIDYGRFTGYFKRSKKAGVVAVYDNAEKISPNNISVLEPNLVTGYNRNKPETMTHVDAGAYVFKKRVLDFIPAGKVCSLEEEIFPGLIKSKQLYYYPVGCRFYDMGTPAELEVLKEKLK